MPQTQSHDPTDSHPTADTATLGRGAGVALFGRIAARGLQVLTEVALARLLGPALLGVYASGWAMVRIAGFLAPLGLDRGVVRFGARHDPDDPAAMKGLIGVALAAALGVGALFGGAFYLLAPSLERGLNKPGLAFVIQGLAPAVALISGLRVAAAITRIRRRMLRSVLAEDLIRGGLQLLILLAVSSLGWGVGGAVLACSASFAVAFAMALWFAMREYADVLTPKVQALTRSPGLFKFSIVSSGAAVSILMMGWIDRIVLAYFRPASEVGIYQVATQPAFVFSAILTAFSAILVPMVAQLSQQGSSSRLERIYRLSTRWGIYVSLPLFLTLCVVPGELLGVVFGPDYRSGATPMLILGAGQMVHAATGAVGTLLVMSGHHRRWMMVAIAFLLVDVLLNVVLVPRYGLVGAATATAISIAALFATGLGLIRKLHGFWPWDRPYLKGLLAAGMTLIPLTWVSRGLVDPGLARVAACAAVAGFGFLGCLALLGFEPEDREFFTVLLRRQK